MIRDRYSFLPEVQRPPAKDPDEVYQRVGELICERNYLESSKLIADDPVLVQLRAELVREMNSQIRRYNESLMGRRVS